MMLQDDVCLARQLFKALDGAEGDGHVDVANFVAGAAQRLPLVQTGHREGLQVACLGVKKGGEDSTPGCGTAQGEDGHCRRRWQE